jgi:hypothetical protein
MTVSRMTSQKVASLTFALALWGIAGCDSNTPTTAEPPKPSAVANPRPDDPLKDVTLENESANMDKIKKAGAGIK